MNILLCALTLLLATGCTVDLGITERAQIRADAQVQVAQAEQAAQDAAAQAIVDAEAERQSGLNRRYATVAFITPFVVGIICLTLIVLLIINWRGRIAFERLKLSAAPATAKLSSTLIAAMAQNGYEPQAIDGLWWPVDVATGKLFRKLIPQHLLEVK
jgi:hypothetical protein